MNNSNCGLCNNACKCPNHVPVEFVDCAVYVEDQCVCDDMGDPKGQCSNCGAKWYEHKLETLPLEERESAAQLQEQFCRKKAK